VGQATSGYLVEVSLCTGEDMDKWRRENAEAFEREYDPAAGLRFEGWLDKGGAK
jgi:hypothetical protein